MGVEERLKHHCWNLGQPMLSILADNILVSSKTIPPGRSHWFPASYIALTARQLQKESLPLQQLQKDSLRYGSYRAKCFGYKPSAGERRVDSIKAKWLAELTSFGEN